MLAVGRLLGDKALVAGATAKLDRLAEDRGFYHDGFWREGSLTAHRRALGQIDGWIKPLLSGGAEPPAPAPARGGGCVALGAVLRPGPPGLLAAKADHRRPPFPHCSAALGWPGSPSVRERTRSTSSGASTPSSSIGFNGRRSGSRSGKNRPRRPRRIGRPGVGLGPLVGQSEHRHRGRAEPSGVHRQGPDAHSRRRLSLFRGGRPRLPGRHARRPQGLPGLNHPIPTNDHRHAGPESRFALSVFDVTGGLQHDQLFHADASAVHWEVPVATEAFPQACSHRGITRGPQREVLRRPVVRRGVWQPPADLPGVRRQRPDDRDARRPRSPPGPREAPPARRRPVPGLHGAGPDIDQPTPRIDTEGRATLLVRRRSAEGATLSSRFVTVLEPTGEAFRPLLRVGRVASPEGTTVVFVETADGPEHLVVNASPVVHLRHPRHGRVDHRRPGGPGQRGRLDARGRDVRGVRGPPGRPPGRGRDHREAFRGDPSEGLGRFNFDVPLERPERSRAGRSSSATATAFAGPGRSTTLKTGPPRRSSSSAKARASPSNRRPGRPADFSSPAIPGPAHRPFGSVASRVDWMYGPLGRERLA